MLLWNGSSTKNDVVRQKCCRFDSRPRWPRYWGVTKMLKNTSEPLMTFNLCFLDQNWKWALKEACLRWPANRQTGSWRLVFQRGCLRAIVWRPWVGFQGRRDVHLGQISADGGLCSEDVTLNLPHLHKSFIRWTWETNRCADWDYSPLHLYSHILKLREIKLIYSCGRS